MHNTVVHVFISSNFSDMHNTAVHVLVLLKGSLAAASDTWQQCSARVGSKRLLRRGLVATR